MVPADKSDSGLSASLGITFAFDESVCALLAPSPTDAKAVFANMIRIMKDKFAVGEIDVVGDDQKETKVAAVSLVGMCELLTHYDVKSSFHFWYKAGTAVKAVRTAKDKPMFYDSENMVGGVFGQIYLLVQQIVLQYESGMAPAVIKPKNDGLQVQLDETHRQLMSLADENLKLKTEMAALKAAAANNNSKELEEKHAKVTEHLRVFVGLSKQNDVINRNVAAVQNGDYKTVADMKAALALARGVKSASNLTGLSGLPSLAAKPVAKPAMAAAAATAAAAAAHDDESDDENAMADAVPKA